MCPIIQTWATTNLNRSHVYFVHLIVYSCISILLFRLGLRRWWWMYKYINMKFCFCAGTCMQRYVVAPKDCATQWNLPVEQSCCGTWGRLTSLVSSIQLKFSSTLLALYIYYYVLYMFHGSYFLSTSFHDNYPILTMCYITVWRKWRHTHTES